MVKALKIILVYLIYIFLLPTTYLVILLVIGEPPEVPIDLRYLLGFYVYGVMGSSIIFAPIFVILSYIASGMNWEKAFALGLFGGAIFGVLYSLEWLKGIKYVENPQTATIRATIYFSILFGLNLIWTRWLYIKIVGERRFDFRMFKLRRNGDAANSE